MKIILYADIYMLDLFVFIIGFKRKISSFLINLSYCVFHGRVAMLFTNTLYLYSINSITQFRITMKYLHNFF